MKEKKTERVFSESCRNGARQQGSKAFRSGASNDEFDGYARYSATRWPKGKLGGNAGVYSRPFLGTGVFLLQAREFPCGSPHEGT